MTLIKDVQSLRETATKLLVLAIEIESRLRPDRPAVDRVDTCTCDVCGDQIKGLAWIGRECEATAHGVACKGMYRLDHEPDRVRLSNGRTLPVTTEQLAMEQAAADFCLPADAAIYACDVDCWGDES